MQTLEAFCALSFKETILGTKNSRDSIKDTQNLVLAVFGYQLSVLTGNGFF